MEINNAEVLAIHRALKISSCCDRIKSAHFVIESDSANAVKWSNSDSEGPWNLTFILNFIRAARRNSNHISIVYKSRGSNGIADVMAKQGLTRQDEFLACI